MTRTTTKRLRTDASWRRAAVVCVMHRNHPAPGTGARCLNTLPGVQGSDIGYLRQVANEFANLDPGVASIV